MNGRNLTIVKRVVRRVQEVLDHRSPNTCAKCPRGWMKGKRRSSKFANRPGVRVIGVLGPAGIGKTTICKAVCEHVSHLYSAVSYVEDVREKATQPRGIVSMQQQIIHDLCKMKDLRFDDSAHGRASIKEHLSSSIKVLIILDDADDFVQVDNLMLPEALGYRSRGIVATRDRCFLSQLETNDIYEVRELTETEALQLFCWHAFMKPTPPHGFEKIATEVAMACSRIPLEVELVGAHLCGQVDPTIWGEVLTKLRLVALVPEEKLRTHKRLHLSYDALPHDQQQIFLDVACVLLDEKAETAIRSSGLLLVGQRRLLGTSLTSPSCL